MMAWFKVAGGLVVAGALVSAVAFAAEDEPDPTKAPPVIAPAPVPAEPTVTGREEGYNDALERCEQALMMASAELEAAHAEPAAAPTPAVESRPTPVPPVVAATPKAETLAGLATLDSVDRDTGVGGRDQVAAIVKGMKPREAAAMVAQWDEGLGADILRRLSPRVAAPVLAAMPAATAARLTAKIASRGGAAP